MVGVQRDTLDRFAAPMGGEPGALLASRYPEMAARRVRSGVLAGKTPGRSSAILDSKDRHSPNTGEALP
jgi:hypothetical protein